MCHIHCPRFRPSGRALEQFPQANALGVYGAQDMARGVKWTVRESNPNLPSQLGRFPLNYRSLTPGQTGRKDLGGCF